MTPPVSYFSLRDTWTSKSSHAAVLKQLPHVSDADGFLRLAGALATFCTSATFGSLSPPPTVDYFAYIVNLACIIAFPASPRDEI